MRGTDEALIVIDVQNDFCPGGALPALGTGQISVFIFVAALICGIFAAKWLNVKLSRAV